MRKVTFGGASRADTFFAGPGEAMDWLLWSDDAAKVSAESWTGVDTILMGRKTYEFAARSRPSSDAGQGDGDAGSEGKFKTYIFSRTMREAPEGAELVRGDAAEFVRALKSQDGGDIIVMGGGELGSALIAGGVVDEIGLNIHPLLLGAGTPVFTQLGRRVALELIEARALKEGCVLVRYRIVS